MQACTHPAAHCVPDVHGTQDPTQKGVAPPHVVPQPPQLPVSLLSFTHTLLQGTAPAVVHVCPQLEPSQVALPPAGAVHAAHAGPQA
jgi:hypothetical protein